MGIPTFGPNTVDWETRIDMDRLRTQRLPRLRAQPERPQLGAVLALDFTHLPAKHHQLYNPWLDYSNAHSDGDPHAAHHGADTRNPSGARAGISTLRGAINPLVGMGENVATKIKRELDLYGLADEPLGVDVIELPVLAALQAAGVTVVDGQQVFLEARRIKTTDEIRLLTHACSMVDAAYDNLYQFLRPGVRENECVGVVAKTLYDLGSEFVEGVNAISGERCAPHPHVFSDRIVRPGDPAFF